MSAISFELQQGFPGENAPSNVLVIRLSVGMDLALDMLPYPTARRSVVTRDIFQDALLKLGDDALHGRGILLRDLKIAGQPVPDLVVHPSVAPGRLQVDGFLGLDFFEKFDVVEWRPKTRLMRLTIE
ncbi:MAG: hypothetical protein QOF01_5327 [Thermomicrobiales bacterium]|nr:hypothetical protein [Thermomicrobiales bacterium]